MNSCWPAVSLLAGNSYWGLWWSVPHFHSLLDKESSLASDEKESNDGREHAKTGINVSNETVNNSESNESLNNDDEDADNAANPLMPGDDSELAGLISENGEINWDCPCLQGMGNGPCGEEFKEAFSCFHYSDADPKGFDCLEQFKAMQECFVKYPDIYGSLDDDLENEENLTESTTQEESNGENEVTEERRNSEGKEIENKKVEHVTEKLENTTDPNS